MLVFLARRDRLACLASRLDKMMFFLACLATKAGAAERWLLHGGYTGYGGTEEYGEGLAKAQVGHHLTHHLPASPVLVI